jgi:hypothetical protein
MNVDALGLILVSLGFGLGFPCLFCLFHS